MQQTTSEKLLLRLKENSHKDPFVFAITALSALGYAIPPNFISQIKKHIAGEINLDFSLLCGAKFGLFRPLAPAIQIFSKFKHCAIPLIAVDEHRWAGYSGIFTLEEWTVKMYNSIFHEITVEMKRRKFDGQEFLDHKPWIWALHTVQEKDLVQTGPIYIADVRPDAEIIKFYQDFVRGLPGRVSSVIPYSLMTMKEIMEKFLSGEFKVTGKAPVKCTTLDECQTLLKEGGNLQFTDFIRVVIAMTQKTILRKHYYDNIAEFIRTGNQKIPIYIPNQNEIGILAPRTPEKIETKHYIPVFTPDAGVTWFTLLFGRVIKGNLRQIIEDVRANSPLEELRSFHLWGLYCPSGKEMVLRSEVSFQDCFAIPRSSWNELFQMDEMSTLLSLVSEEIERKRARDEEGGEIEDQPPEKIPRI